MLKFTVLLVCVRGTYLVGPSRGKDSFLEDWGGRFGLGGKIFVNKPFLYFITIE